MLLVNWSIGTCPQVGLLKLWAVIALRRMKLAESVRDSDIDPYETTSALDASEGALVFCRFFQARTAGLNLYPYARYVPRGTGISGPLAAQQGSHPSILAEDLGPLQRRPAQPARWV